MHNKIHRKINKIQEIPVKYGKSVVKSVAQKQSVRLPLGSPGSSRAGTLGLWDGTGRSALILYGHQH
jgi:hypothetical protein